MELFRKRKREQDPELTEDLTEIDPEQQEQESGEDQELGQETEDPGEQNPEQKPGQEPEDPGEQNPEQNPEQEPGEEQEPEQQEQTEESSELPEEKALTLAALLETLSPEGVELFRKALAEAEIRGRNSAVEEHLVTIDDSDGVPHPGCGQGASLRNRPASIFDLARLARQ